MSTAKFTAVAVVEPSFAATVVADHLVASWHAGVFDKVRLEERRAVAEVIAALVGSASEWRNGERNERNAEQGVVGAERNGASGPGGSAGVSRTMSTQQAAQVLGVSRRRAQQLASDGLGRLAGRRWVLDVDLVQAELDRRRLAS